MRVRVRVKGEARLGHEGLQPIEQGRHRLAARSGDGEDPLVARSLGQRPEQ